MEKLKPMHDTSVSNAVFEKLKQAELLDSGSYVNKVIVGLAIAEPTVGLALRNDWGGSLLMFEPMDGRDGLAIAEPTVGLASRSDWGGSSLMFEPMGGQDGLAKKAVDSYRASSAFEDEVYRRAYAIHDEVVLDCRHILRKKLVPEEVVLLIGPEVPDIDESVFDAPVVEAPLDDFGDIEIIEALNSLHGDDVSDVP